MEDFLRIRNISKSFGKVRALNNISLDVNEGEILGIIGPNGAGKTTLFNVIAGYYRPDSGMISFAANNITRLSVNDRVKLGLCRTFQIPRPFRELTTFENIKVCTLFNKKVKTLTIPLEDYLKQLLENVGLEEYTSTKACFLGYGNLKRLEFVRAEATFPKVLLLDEPFAGLSFGEINSVSEIFLDLKVTKGLTVIIVEHKLRELMKIVDRIVVLNYGEKIAEGIPEAIRRDEKVIKSYLGARWEMHDSGD